MSRCRLCLNSDSIFENFTEDADLQDKVKAVFPKMQLSLVKDPKFCQVCMRRIQYTYNFKCCVSIADVKTRSQLSQNSTAKEDIVKILQNTCRLCLKPKTSVDLIPMCEINGFSKEQIRVMIEESLMDLDCDLFENPAICGTCWIIVKQICTFKKDYSENEQRLKFYSQKINKPCLENTDIDIMLRNNCDIKKEPLTEGSLINKLISSDVEEIDDTFDEEEGKLGRKEKDIIPKTENLDSDECTNSDKADDVDDVFVEVIGMKREEHLGNPNNEIVPECQEPTTNENISDNPDVQDKENNNDTSANEKTSTSKWTNFKGRRKKISAVKYHSCTRCSYNTTNLQHFKRHMLQHETETPLEMLKCQSCPYETHRKNYLKMHSLTHGKDEKNCKNNCVQVVKCHSCEHCPYNTTNLQHFKRHLLRHESKTSLQMFKCPVCPYETYRKDHLKTHCLTHGKDDKNNCAQVELFTCDICEYTTNRRYSLKRHHMQVHNTDVKKSFKCVNCSYVGKRKTDLDSHMKSHAKKSDFECLNCGYKTKRKSSLKTHMLKHRTFKQFECNKCGYKTNRKEHLKLHITNVKCKPKIKCLK